MCKVEDKRGIKRDYKRLQSIIRDLSAKKSELEVRIKILDYNQL